MTRSPKKRSSDSHILSPQRIAEEFRLLLESGLWWIPRAFQENISSADVIRLHGGPPDPLPQGDLDLSLDDFSKRYLREFAESVIGRISLSASRCPVQFVRPEVPIGIDPGHCVITPELCEATERNIPVRATWAYDLYRYGYMLRFDLMFVVHRKQDGEPDSEGPRKRPARSFLFNSPVHKGPVAPGRGKPGNKE